MATQNERYATLGFLILMGSIALAVVVCVYFVEPYHNTRGYDPLTCKVAQAQLNLTEIECQCKAETCHIQIPCLILKVDVLGSNVTDKLAFPTYQAYKAVLINTVDSSHKCSKLYADCTYNYNYDAGLFTGAPVPSTIPSYWAQGKEIPCNYRPNSPVILSLFPTSAVVMALLCSFSGIAMGIGLMAVGALVKTREFRWTRSRVTSKMSKPKRVFAI